MLGIVREFAPLADNVAQLNETLFALARRRPKQSDPKNIATRISFSISVEDIRRMFVERLSERTGVERRIIEAEPRAEEARCRTSAKAWA